VIKIVISFKILKSTFSYNIQSSIFKDLKAHFIPLFCRTMLSKVGNQSKEKKLALLVFFFFLKKFLTADDLQKNFIGDKNMRLKFLLYLEIIRKS